MRGFLAIFHVLIGSWVYDGTYAFCVDALSWCLVFIGFL